ncbi:hypothetical protein MMC29_008540 [Sticta canariensis]|nr:hypothetical protein [Sticta canariensis]
MDDTISVKSASPTGTTASSGTKRKRNTEKFYAVRVGYHPGVYHSWADCLEQVKGFKKATYKSFSTLTDAERYLAGENPSQAGGSVSSPSAKFYAVKNGRVPGIYTDWPSAQDQITGWTKPRHKCFTTRVEAQRFLDEDDQRGSETMGSPRTNVDNSIMSPFLEGIDEMASKPLAPKRARRGADGNTRGLKQVTVEYNEDDYEPGLGPLPPGASDGFDYNILLDSTTGQLVYKTQEQRQATKLQQNWGAQNEMLRIHTDGSSLGNGTADAFAGVGVYFGPGDERNISETLPGPRQTNQRAELTAILRALQIVPRNRDVSIVSDSRYAIDCVTVWHVNWRKNGWKTSAGKAVENKDLVESVLAKIEERNSLAVQTTFEWIKGHANHPGNVEADKLAINGARKGAL